ncbi:MAG: esterase [Myxococcota bacterium]
MSFVVANGVRFHCMELGEGSPVVMLHGLLVGNLAGWYFTGARALSRKHRVLLYDLRGHGRSEQTRSGYDVATMTDDLEALVEQFTDEPVTLVGHSYGALISLEFARRHPNRVAKVVVVDAPLPPAETSDLTAFVKLNPAEMVDALPGPLQAAVRSGGRRMNRLLNSLVFLATQTDLPKALDEREPPTDEELAQITAETLCIYGSQSSCLPAGERLRDVLPNAELVVIEGGHYLIVEAPGPLCEAIIGFLDGPSQPEAVHG